jgi:hypothetical protein
LFALLASLVVVAYLVVPGVLFKSVFSLFVPYERSTELELRSSATPPSFALSHSFWRCF